MLVLPDRVYNQTSKLEDYTKTKLIHFIDFYNKQINVFSKINGMSFLVTFK